MKKIKFISPFSLIIFLILFLFFNIFIFKEVSFPQNIPDKLFFYSAKHLKQIIESYSFAEKQNYINGSVKFDFVYPIVYSFLLFLSIAILFRRSSEKKQLPLFSFIPFFALIADYSENLLIINIIKNQNFDMQLAHVASVLTLSKWLFVFFSILIIFFLIFKIFYRLIKQKKHQ